MKSILLRLPEETAKNLSLLVGHSGHKSMNDVLIMACEAYERLNLKQIADIKKGDKR